ncbi:response regulator transcription factor [Streptococcus sp. DD12]|uniref:response regulator transcription factor n=1 Tax=Streptococcus sp. DD12 TaxID=1777880 RepID=UPI00079A653A|nr:response regulator transcription factor [Streptococcus sp. DD12]KXT76534.1 Phosphate regulon transcriptional regulatory protein PhoB (SphR) [Streptococcus sp. DD12]
MARVYVADDERNIRELIGSFLEKEGMTVSLFETGDQLLVAFLKEPADVVVLDVMMPGTDGFGIAKEIRSISEVPIILLTARDSDLDFVQGFETGADDYFTKPFSAVKLTLRIKAIIQRQALDRPEKKDLGPLSYGGLHLSAEKRQAFYQDQPIKLTNTEYDLLQMLMQHQGAAVSRDELLEAIWGYASDVETRVTDDTIKRLRKKLRMVESHVIIETVWGYGFKLVTKSLD